MQSTMDFKELSNQSVAIIGLGNQAKTWALNLFDSKHKIAMGIRSWHEQAKQFKIDHPQIELNLITKEWIAKQNIIVLLIPDDQHLQFLNAYAGVIKPKTIIIYAHGFSETTHQLTLKFAQLYHVLLAPKSIASEMRSHYLEKKILAAVYSLSSNIAKEDAVAIEPFIKKLATDLGITWGPFPVTFKQECMADLFSEQTMLCNIVPNLTAHAYQTLINKGIPWQLAFCEIFLELKLVVNALEKVGPSEFFKLISPNALMGGEHYAQEWNKKVPWQELFDSVWNSLENGQMLEYLQKTPADDVRTNVLNFWEKHPMNADFIKFKQDTKEI